MTRLVKLHALLATSRVANIPSVVSNVSLGAALAASGGSADADLVLKWVALSVAGILLYVSGNFLNDWMDRQWDAIHRPERALPAGIFKDGHYLATAVTSALGGVLIAAAAGPAAVMAALGILVFIVIYTRWHKSSSWAVIPMGLCRALLIVLGAAGVAGNGFPVWVAPHALALLIYIAALSLSARYETSANPPPAALFCSRFLLISAGLAMSSVWLFQSPLPAAVGLLPFSVWLALCLSRFRRPVPVHVSALLAGIPLLDWVALIPLALTGSQAETAPGLAAACWLIPPLAFLSGRLLQRVAPAT